jgi:integrase
MSVFTFADEKEPGRKRGCIAAVKLFLDHIFGVQRANRGYTTKESWDLYEEIGTKYLNDKNRDHLKDLLSFKKNTVLSPRTARAYLGIIREFFEENQIELTLKEKRVLKKAYQGGGEAPDDAPDHMQIRSFIDHSDVRMKAVALLLSSSGMRIGELLSIREDSINFSRRMITLRAGETKTKQGRVVFFSKEAETALNQFLKVRTKYIEKNNLKALKLRPDTQTIDDGRIFSYDPITLNRAWRRNLKRANMFVKNGYDRATFHPHALRQFFSTQMRKNGCPDSIVEILLGHTPYLATYIRYSPRELQEAYEKYSPVLEIGTDDMVRKTVASIAEASTKQAEELTKIKQEKAALEERLQQLERREQTTQKLNQIRSMLSDEDRESLKKLIIDELKEDAARSK